MTATGGVYGVMRRARERLGRVRWLEWTNVVFWGLLGGYGFFRIPRLEPVFASFGSDLPTSTTILLRARPLFIIPLAAAVVCAALLAVRPRANPIGRRHLWAGAGAALVAAYLTVSAIFAPMFCGSLAEAPRSRPERTQ